jgi:hypothetical protein
MVQDLSSIANLIGFTRETDGPHVVAIRAANARPIRKAQLSWMVPRFIFTTAPLCDQAREAILNFKNNLPYQYEEHRNISEAQEHLAAEALEYAEMADLENYQAYRTKENSDEIAIVHVSPTAAKPENVARAEEASKYLRQTSLWTWASKYFEEKTLGATFTVEAAITLARETDARDLFEHSSNENDDGSLGMRRGAVAATAAVVLSFRKGRTDVDLEWAREVLARAIRLPEIPGSRWSSGSVIPWHQAIYVARGLAADFREGTSVDSTPRDLLSLIAHPLEIVSLAALEEVFNLWSKDPKLTWTALILSFSLCHVLPRPQDQLRQHGDALHSVSEAEGALGAALAFYETGNDWSPLPLPPPAWVRVEPSKGRQRYRNHDEYNEDDVADANEFWGEPDIFWYSKQAAEILKRIPFDEILRSGARNALLDFLAGILDWTNRKNAPPWVRPGRRDRSSSQIFEWTRALGSSLGRVAGLLPLCDYQVRFLDPILRLEGDNCWALLSPFASTYICAYVYDAPVVPTDAVTMLDLCLGRFLVDPTFDRDAFRSGEFSGFDQPKLVGTLMFVAVEHADLAARYVNGNWSEIGRILPLIDRFIRAGGWAASVMTPFLTLCERAKTNYPAELFADQMLAVIRSPAVREGRSSALLLRLLP